MTRKTTEGPPFLRTFASDGAIDPMAFIALPQDSVRVDVSFYNENERQSLLRFPTAPAIETLAAGGINVPTAEFLTYYLFHRKRLGTGGYRDYQSIGDKLDKALAALDECIEFGGRSIHTPAGTQSQLTEISEHIGEAVGLSVIARIHGVTEADWAPIPTQAGRHGSPTFDFEMASDGDMFVQVENKGSSVRDNRRLDQAVKAQYRRIVRKKAKLNTRAAAGTDPHPASLRYGTITVVDARSDGNVRCLLTDPPPETVDETPRRFRLLQRMRFIRDWVSAISVRSQLAAALSTRVADLETMGDPFELSGVALRRGNGQPFDFTPHRAFGAHSSFLVNKSRVVDGPAGGEVVRLSTDALFMLGIREDLVALAASQDTEGILTYQNQAATLEKTVECVVSRPRLGSLRLPESVLERAGTSGQYVRFELRGQLHYSPFGLVFGELPLPAR